MTPRAKNWDHHVGDAEEISRRPGFQLLRDRIVELAELTPEETVVDVGAGTGLLALAIAPRVEAVWAIDVSAAMTRYLEAKAASGALANLRSVTASATSLPLMDGVADVVVSNYCLHHLRDRDKHRALSYSSTKAASPAPAAHPPQPRQARMGDTANLEPWLPNRRDVCST